MTTVPPVVALVGPTAAGKSGLAVAVALSLGGAEVVSADSMQIYRGMDIGTAKLPVAERRGVPHHLLDMLEDPDCPRPAAIIGCPVGFVGAAESKAALIQAPPVPALIVEGRIGGSAITAAAVLSLVAGCGDLEPPATDIGKTVGKKSPAPRMPVRTQPVRMDYGDGEATLPAKPKPAKDDNPSRLGFGDTGRP